MIKQKIKINDEIGLHARPASRFAKIAKQFNSEIKLTYNGKTVNGKSSIKLITLNVKPHEEMVMEINGSDEEKALAALIGVFK